MLKTIRRLLAMLSFIAITLLLLDFTGATHAWFGWLAKVQFLPAVLALNIVALVAIVLLTLLLGRIYCSIVCPLGIMQDGVAWVRRRFKRLPYTYSAQHTRVRWGIFMLFVVGMLVHLKFITLLAPYSTYGRFATAVLQPLYVTLNNVCASIAESYDSYMFYHRDVIWFPISLISIVALHTLIIIVLAWRGGRTYCNTICPVGTLLGLLSRFALYKVRFDSDKCKRCGKCMKICKASCIDSDNQTIDYSRCVVCGNCTKACSFGALRLSTSAKQASCSPTNHTQPINNERRAFLVGATLATSAAAMAQVNMKVDGGLAIIEDKQPTPRRTPITPAGSLSAQNMAAHCTTCQLCISACPNDVLRPSTDLSTLMMPTMSYERGYCRPECTRCADICPTSAIHKISAPEKTAIHIGHAVLIAQNCISATNGIHCGNCARHCPVGAITMVPSEYGNNASNRIPAINEDACIGCGACENLCPVRPYSAIYVEGHEVHREG